MSDLAVGDRVRCATGRLGRVVSVNVAQSVGPEWPDVTEYGVSFDNTTGITAWFAPSELVLEALRGPQSDDTGLEVLR